MFRVLPWINVEQQSSTRGFCERIVNDTVADRKREPVVLIFLVNTLNDCSPKLIIFNYFKNLISRIIFNFNS